MRQKEEFLDVGEGVQDGDPSHFGPESASSHLKWLVSNPLACFVDKPASRKGGAVTWLCLKLAISLISLKLMIFSRNFFNRIDAWNSYLADASVKYHLPLRGGFWHRIRHLYHELEVIKACGEGGTSSVGVAHCLHIQHLNAEWGYFSRQRKKPFCVLHV
jgi:hypothetical protein